MKENYIRIESIDSKNIENNIQNNYISKYAFITISFIIMILILYLTIHLCIKIENKNESLFYNKKEENLHIFQLIEKNNRANYSFKATYEANLYNESVDLRNGNTKKI